MPVSFHSVWPMLGLETACVWVWFISLSVTSFIALCLDIHKCHLDTLLISAHNSHWTQSTHLSLCISQNMQLLPFGPVSHDSTATCTPNPVVFDPYFLSFLAETISLLYGSLPREQEVGTPFLWLVSFGYSDFHLSTSLTGQKDSIQQQWCDWNFGCQNGVLLTETASISPTEAQDTHEDSHSAEYRFSTSDAATCLVKSLLVAFLGRCTGVCSNEGWCPERMLSYLFSKVFREYMAIFHPYLLVSYPFGVCLAMWGVW